MTADEQALDPLKQQIAELWQEREHLKAQLPKAQTGEQRTDRWRQLETLDARVSELDTRFARIWSASSNAGE